MGKKWKKVQKRCVRVVDVAQSSPQRLKYIYLFLFFCKKRLTLAFWCKKVHRFSKFHFFSDFSSLWFESNGMGGHEKFLKVRYLQKNLSNQGFTFFGKLFFWILETSDSDWLTQIKAANQKFFNIQNNLAKNPKKYDYLMIFFEKYVNFSQKSMIW